MRGHIRARGKDKNHWQICLYRGQRQGRSVYDYQTFEGTRKDAERELARLVNDKHQGAYVAPSRQRVDEFLREWLVYIEPFTQLRTSERYREIVEKHLIPAFGQHRLDRLKSEHVHAYIARALKTGRLDGRGGLSETTVRHHVRVLHEALEYAISMDKLGRNPVNRNKVRLPHAPPREMQTLTAAEVLRLLDVIRRSRTSLFMPVLLAATTGLRRGEVLGLRWGDVDLDAGRITVQQTVQKTKTAGLVVKAPKTVKSRRTVDLMPLTIEALRRHQQEQAHERKVIGLRPDRSALVCADADGSPLDPDYVTQAFAALVKRTPNMPRVRYHDLRHGFATMLLGEGVPAKIVSEALGHSKTGITQDLYSHVTPGMQKEAARKLGDAFERAASPKTGRG